MTINYSNLNKVLRDIKNYHVAKLLIVTKNQSVSDIQDLIKQGFKIFGENKVQEAKKKFQEINLFEKINLHLIGPLQTNKTKDALKLFDTIQSIDREKLVNEISNFMKHEQEIKTKSFYIQINIGSESQKSGIEKKLLNDFYRYAIDRNLNINGLMCIPPNDSLVKDFFLEMDELRNRLNPNLILSMGMSNDYQVALDCKSNLIRVGSLIFND